MALSSILLVSISAWRDFLYTGTIHYQIFSRRHPVRISLSSTQLIKAHNICAFSVINLVDKDSGLTRSASTGTIEDPAAGIVDAVCITPPLLLVISP